MIRREDLPDRAFTAYRRVSLKELMVNFYKAIIEGCECEVEGWTSKGTLLLADGREIAITPLDRNQQLGGNIWRIARLTCVDSSAGGAECCLIDGEKLATVLRNAKIQRGELAERQFRTLNHLFKEIDELYPFKGNFGYTVPKGGVNQTRRIVGVMWSGDRMARGKSPYFLPILLSRFDFLANSHGFAMPKLEIPEFFCTYASAAGYAKVDRRTIQNWKKAGWLRVEQNGRKIRIARSDLDQCKKER